MKHICHATGRDDRTIIEVIPAAGKPSLWLVQNQYGNTSERIYSSLDNARAAVKRDKIRFDK